MRATRKLWRPRNPQHDQRCRRSQDSAGHIDRYQLPPVDPGARAVPRLQRVPPRRSAISLHVCHPHRCRYCLPLPTAAPAGRFRCLPSKRRPRRLCSRWVFQRKYSSAWRTISIRGRGLRNALRRRGAILRTGLRTCSTILSRKTRAQHLHFRRRNRHQWRRLAAAAALWRRGFGTRKLYRPDSGERRRCGAGEVTHAAHMGLVDSPFRVVAAGPDATPGRNWFWTSTRRAIWWPRAVGRC